MTFEVDGRHVVFEHEQLSHRSLESGALKLRVRKRIDDLNPYSQFVPRALDAAFYKTAYPKRSHETVQTNPTIMQRLDAVARNDLNRRHICQFMNETYGQAAGDMTECVIRTLILEIKHCDPTGVGVTCVRSWSRQKPDDRGSKDNCENGCGRRRGDPPTPGPKARSSLIRNSVRFRTVRRHDADTSLYLR